MIKFSCISMNFPTNLTNLHACFWHVLSFGVNIDIFPLNWGTSCDGISVLPYLIDIKENHISESIFAQVTFKKFMVTHVYPQANKDWKKLRYACLDLEMLKTFLDTSPKKCCFMYSSFVVNMIKLSGICCCALNDWEEVDYTLWEFVHGYLKCGVLELSGWPSCYYKCARFSEIFNILIFMSMSCNVLRCSFITRLFVCVESHFFQV